MMAPSPEDAESLLRRIAELEGRLEEAEATLHALGSGQVDAVVVSGPESDQVYTLKGADAPYRVMVQSMSEGALTLMPDGLILFSNEQFASLVGRPLGRVMGARIQELIAPEDAGVIADLLSGGHAAKAEMCLLGESGHVPVYFSLGTLVLDGKQYMCATATDLTQQKSHERVLAAERFARAIVDQSTGVILVADPGGRIIRASRGAEQLAGGEVALRPFDNVFPIGFEEIFARVRETGHVAGVETTAQMPDGRTLQLTLDATLLFGPDDRQIRGCIVVLNDVTRLKRAEQALRDSEEQFRTVADSIAQLAWMADDQGASLWYNRRWYEYTGTTLDEVRDWGWQKLHHPDHVRSVTAHFRHCVETGEPWEDTFPLRGRDGNYRWFLSRAMPIRGADGRILRWFGTNTDITERLESEQRLRQSEARFRRLYDADVVGILSADVHTVYDANDVFLNLIGYSREELQTGRIRWRDLTPPEYLELDEQGIEELLRTGSCKPFEKEYIRKDGARVPVLIGAILLERDPLRWLCVVLDLTERKQLEKHVLEAQKLESAARFG
ncbi:MAG: PAS domain S-box protein, partial [Acidobacteria bacterium]|nr:PAS domain S-box protein [Acidobacteriota bacterium]